MTENGRKSPNLNGEFISNNENNSSMYNLQDLYRIIQVQQKTINKLNAEISKKSQSVSRELYEQSLNDYEVL